MIAYLDSSAFVKLVKEEDESAALARGLRDWADRASSILLRVEVLRAARLAGVEAVARAEAMLDDIALLPLSGAIVEAAIEVGPGPVRSLEAIHIASALALGEDLAILVSYDGRMLEAATRAGIETLSPGGP